jgi:roadblock/LC7 domain-containing protein
MWRSQLIFLGLLAWCAGVLPSRADEAPFLGKIILFGAQREGDDRPTIMAMAPDGTELVELWRPETGGVIAAGRISNDGRRLAFMLHAPGGAGHELWTLDSKLKAIKIAEDAVIAAWSPDDNRMACFRGKGARTYDNFILDLESKREERLPLPDSDVVNDWSPDGTWLTVMASNRENRFEHAKNGSYPLRRVYRIDLDGGREAPISGDVMTIVERRDGRSEEHPLEEFYDDIWSRISPDGSQVTYQQRSHANLVVRHATIVQSVDRRGAAAVIMYEDHAERYEQYKANNFAVWSPDGNALVSPLAAHETVKEGEETRERLVCELLFASAKTGFTHKLRMNELGIRFVQGIDWR